ncbi:MAG TPA: hypothetical protein VFV58_26995 [Blastocatellia bacterium]|nr:hypothetical protein [Blastocatellia bacterium]
MIRLIIKNGTRHLLTLTLNSGDTLHLAPGERSRPLSEIETNNNTKIERLLRERWIEIIAVSGQASAEGGAEPAAPRRKPRS